MFSTNWVIWYTAEKDQFLRKKQQTETQKCNGVLLLLLIAQMLTSQYSGDMHIVLLAVHTVHIVLSHSLHKILIT